MDAPTTPPSLRLFCVPDAGASAASFRGWQDRLPETVEVIGVTLPGRGEREDEQLPTQMASLVEGLLGTTGTTGRAPFAILGQGTGALVAFEWVRHLESLGQRPTRLVVVGCKAPATAPATSDAARDRTAQEELRLNRVPAGFLRDPEVRAHFLPALKADLAMCGGWEPAPDRIATPILALGGTEEFGESAAGLKQWARWTCSQFDVVTVPGGHAFLGTHYRAFFDALEDALAPPSDLDPSLWHPTSGANNINPAP